MATWSEFELLREGSNYQSFKHDYDQATFEKTVIGPNCRKKTDS
jgi:hypothetical protein